MRSRKLGMGNGGGEEKLCFKLMGCDIFVIDKYNCE